MSTIEKLPSQLYAAPPVREKREKPKSFGELLRQSETDLFVENDQMPRALKAAFIGLNGSGKTFTMALLAIGISKTYHGGAPVMMHDSEDPASDFLVPIFKMEGVPFLRKKSISFRHACAAIHEGPRKGACVLIEDSMTKDWNDLQERFKKSYNPPLEEIEMWHWPIIKPVWNGEWVEPMLASPMHVLIGGRLGDRWEGVIKADGKERIEAVDTKMKAEGEFGYEPSMLIEMHSDRVTATKLTEGRDRKRKRSGGDTIHTAFIKKDRSRVLQGKSFTFPAINEYKAGDWKKVFALFEPHMSIYDIAGKTTAPEQSASSDANGPLFTSGGNNAFYQRKQEAIIAIEEIDGTLQAIWPGQTADAKKFRGMAIYTLFGTRSWTAVTALPIDELQAGLVRLKAIELNTKNTPMDEEDVVLQVLNESMGKASVPPINTQAAAAD